MTKEKTLKELMNGLQFTYLGNVDQSAKMHLSYVNHVSTYGLYLAPADLSGYNVCPNNKWCKASCLNESGRNKIELLSKSPNKIQSARIAKTKLFFEDRNRFMAILVSEIKRHKNYAESHNMEFAVRLNCTSDIDITNFVYNGKCILDIFPDIQFYDYTKVSKRLSYNFKNYDLTYSYNGHNWENCESYLKKNGNVAVVFNGKKLPVTFKGYKVIDGNLSDIRYKDPKGCIVGLHYHKVAGDYKNGKYQQPNNDFVILESNTDCKY